MAKRASSATESARIDSEYSATPIASEKVAGAIAALLNRKQLAAAINVSPRTVDNLQRRKIIPVVQLSARCCRFSLPAVLRALGKFEVKEATR
jgi:FixJ family two-component response regulator